ncbi:hypothetical protein [Bosea sp. (in: a-proteobacteria)]|uniref:hypothetical protein n=1 Tax=Bosea sp. (in: a-proteobacteria) TaxID=1871050 RepID=UPI0012118F21|nr:hypothetical protein [Bosea sp. (in: a-proteobacteria)]TAJ33791.1 MAG: hypothetical protein EPO59_03965 [Bosea sp. (in: a-proteobacteria)]
MNHNGVPSADETLPEDGEMRLYARAYKACKPVDDLLATWQVHHAHAALLERKPDRFHPEYGLNQHQLAAGARIAAERMALLIAEAPATERVALAHKIHVFETMIVQPGRNEASNVLVMVEAAMKEDAARLGILLMPLDAAFARTQ